MICPNNEIDFINDVDGDYDRYTRALEKIEEDKRKEALSRHAYTEGYYSDLADRISEFKEDIKKLVGRTMTIEGLDEYKFEDLTIEKVEALYDDVVLINDEYEVNLAENSLLNKDGFVSLGSEAGGIKGRNTKSMRNLKGNVLAVLDDLVKEAVKADGVGLDPRLKQVFDTYKKVLESAGAEVEVDVEFMKDLDNLNTMGEADPDTGKIRLLTGNTRYNSHADILAHELQHVLIRNFLKTNEKFKSEAMRLRDAIKAEGVIDYRVFLPEKPTSEDIEYAKERYRYVFENSSKTAADEFLAAATTNTKLMDVLGAIRNPKELNVFPEVDVTGDKAKSKWRKIWNRLIKGMNTIYNASVKKNKSGRDLALDLVNKAMELEYTQKQYKDMNLYEKAINKIMSADRKMARFGERQKKEQRSYEENIREKGKLSQAIDAIWNIRGLNRAKSALLQNNVFNSLTRDMEQPDVAKFYRMFRHTKAFLENAIAPLKMSTIKMLSEDYGMDKLDVEVRRGAKRAILDTDAKVLGDAKEILSYLEDDSKVEKEIESISKEFSGEVLDEANELASLLVTNVSNKANISTNAHHIGNKYLGEQVGERVSKVDKLVTLLAIKKTGKENKKHAVEAIKGHESGVNKLINMIKQNELKLLEKAYSGDRMYLAKGATQEHYKGNKQHYIVDAKEAKALTKAKLTMLGKHEALSKALGKDMYVVVGDSIEPGYTEGLLSKVQLRSEGDSLRRLLIEVNGLTEEEANDRIDDLINEQKDGSQALIPERSGHGTIYDYKVRIPYEAKTKYLGLDDDIVWSTAETVANLTHKQEAMVNNRASLHYFKNFYEKYRNSNKFKFVEISEKATGKYKQYWDELPYYMKKELIKNHKGKLMIEESFLVDFFGYKDVSIVNMPIIRNSKKRQLFFKKIENIIQEITGTWKNSVVAKSIDTVLGNNGSNMFVALQHTDYKSPITYLEEFSSIWKDMNRYNKLKAQKTRMDLDKAAGEPVNESKYKSIVASMENTRVHGIIKDGQYSSIMEDLDHTWFDEKGILEEKLDNALDKLKRKNGKIGVKDILDTLYIRKGSVFYDSTMKATLYSDIITKIIISESLANQANRLKKEGKSSAEIAKDMLNASEAEIDRFFSSGKTPQTWYNYLDQLTVNYSYLDNRWIKYANDTLMLSFTKYFFRVFPAMMKMVKNRGVSVFFTEAVQEVVGLDAETPIDQFYNPYDSLSRKVGGIFDIPNLFKTILTLPIAR